MAENTVIRSRPVITVDMFVYAMPVWAVKAVRMIFLLFGIGAAILLYFRHSQIPLFVTIFVGFLGSVFFLVALHPRTGSQPIYFLSDARGMYFPSYQSQMLFPQGDIQTWLFVPWENITRIRTDIVFTGDNRSKGILFSVKATEQEARRYFGQSAFGGLNLDQEGRLIVGYANVFQKPEEAADVLRKFQEGKNPIVRKDIDL